MGRPAGKRLAPMLRELVAVLRQFGELVIDDGAEVIALGRSADKASTASVSYRCADDLSEVTRGWTAAGIAELAAAAPWRTVRWYRGKRH